MYVIIKTNEGDEEYQDQIYDWGRRFVAVTLPHDHPRAEERVRVPTYTSIFIHTTDNHELVRRYEDLEGAEADCAWINKNYRFDHRTDISRRYQSKQVPKDAVPVYKVVPATVQIVVLDEAA